MCRRIGYRIVLLLGFSLVALSGCLRQAPFVEVTDVVGEIKIAEGFPSVTRNARPYILDEQSLIYTGDVLRTDRRSRLTAELISSHQISLSPESQLLLVKAEQRNDEVRMQLSLSSGSAEISSHNTDLPEGELTVRTNIANISSHSGSFWLGYENDGSVLTVISLDDSGLRVFNSDGGVEITKAFQSTTIAPGVAPGNISTLSDARARRTIDFYHQIQAD